MGRWGHIDQGIVSRVMLSLFHLLPPGVRTRVRSMRSGQELVLMRPDVARACARKEYSSRRYSSPLLDYQYDSIVRSQLPALLRYEDRNSMAHSVETRLPFLDHRLVEYAFRLPDKVKLHGGVSKLILRRTMRGIVPDMILDRRDKIGFATPERDWLLGPLSGVIRERFSQAQPIPKLGGE